MSISQLHLFTRLVEEAFGCSQSSFAEETTMSAENEPDMKAE